MISEVKGETTVQQNYRTAIMQEQVRLAMGHIPTMQGAGYLVALALAFFYWESTSVLNLSIWLGGVTAVAISRAFFYLHFRKKAQDDFAPEPWRNGFIAFTTVSSGLWGSSAYFLFPVSDVSTQLFLLFVIASVCATTVVSHSSLRLAPLAAILMTMVPFMVRFVWIGGMFGYMVSFMCLLYICTNTLYSFGVHKSILGSIQLRFENLKLLEDLRQANRLKDQFISLVSHDLRSPIASIKSMAELTDDLLREGSPVEEIRQFVPPIYRSAGALLNVIDHLLNISRLQTGNITPMRRTISPRQIVDEQILLVSQRALTKKVNIVNEIDPSMHVIADPVLYGRVIGNLLSNAVKFTEGGSVRIFASDEANPAIIIQDEGVGIPLELQKDIFRHEVRTTTLGTAGEAGTGLGLPYCLDIMKAHGGSIEVRSEKGKGSSFYVRLPSAKNSVIIVDNSEPDRARICQILKQSFEVDVRETSNAEEALEEACQGMASLLILDVDMKGISIKEFVDRLRAAECSVDVPILLLVSPIFAQSKSSLLQEGLLEAGAFDILRKPVQADKLIRAVSPFL